MESGIIVLVTTQITVCRYNVFSLLKQNLNIEYIGIETAKNVEYELIDKILLGQLKNLISIGKKYIFWDLPANTIKQRKPILKIAKDSNFKTLIFVIDNKNSNDRIEYEEPDYDEDISQIIYKKEL